MPVNPTDVINFFGFILPTFVVYAIFGGIILFLIVMIYLIYAGRNKEIVLYFETDKVAKIHKKIPDDEGKVKIDNKEFNLRRADPRYLKGSFGIKPLYICRYDNPIPLAMDQKYLKADIIPETMKDLSEMGTLKSLINIDKDTKMGMKDIILMALVGGFCFMIGLMVAMFGIKGGV